MSQLQNFLFENQEVRFVGTVDVPEWLAVDVCRILELGNPSQALSDFDEDEKGITSSDTPGGLQGTERLARTWYWLGLIVRKLGILLASAFTRKAPTAMPDPPQCDRAGACQYSSGLVPHR